MLTSTIRFHFNIALKLSLVIQVIAIFILSCNTTNTYRNSNDTTVLMQQSKTAIGKTRRQLLIEELNRLRAVFASKDIEKIAELFPFPLYNETVDLYIDDNAFNAEYRKEENKITKAMFIRFYPQISENLQIEEINKLFAQITLDSLQQRDAIESKVLIKNEPCYHYCNVEIEDDVIKLTVGTNTNENYQNKSLTGDEMPENSNEICEHMICWMFKFDGKQVHLKKIWAAD